MKSQILKKIIQDGPINVSSLENMLKVLDIESSDREVRLAVAELVQEGWPIVSGNKGYWIAKSLKDKRVCIQRLRSQVKAVEQRIKDLNKAYYSFQNKGNRDLYNLLKNQKRKIKRRKL